MRPPAGYVLAALLALVAPAAHADGPTDASFVVFQPRRTVALSARVRTVVTEAAFPVGARVAKDDVLVRLDARRFEAERQRADESVRAIEALVRAHERAATRDPFAAKLQRAQAMVDAAAVQLRIQQRLYNERTSSELELSKATAELAVATADKEIVLEAKAQFEIERDRDTSTLAARLASDQAMARLALLDVEACALAAPFAGRIKRRFAEPGTSVEPGQVLVELIDDVALLAYVLVPSRELGGLSLGSPVAIQVAETGAVVAGELAEIGAAVEASSSTVRVGILVDNAGGTLRSGMRGRRVAPVAGDGSR